MVFASYPKDLPSNALRDADISMAVKRPRCVDEDFKRMVIHRGSHGQASTGSIVRNLDVVAASTGQRWGVADLAQHQCANWIAFRHSRIFGVSYDATKLGQPKEEVQTFVVTDGFVSTWSLPMVLREHNTQHAQPTTGWFEHNKQHAHTDPKQHMRMCAPKLVRTFMLSSKRELCTWYSQTRILCSQTSFPHPPQKSIKRWFCSTFQLSYSPHI
jgi:hypothetical protein